jgi:hypothetical protein
VCDVPHPVCIRRERARVRHGVCQAGSPADDNNNESACMHTRHDHPPLGLISSAIDSMPAAFAPAIDALPF